MRYSPAERVTCPHVICNITWRQSRLTVLDLGLHIQKEKTPKESCNTASYNFQ